MKKRPMHDHPLEGTVSGSRAWRGLLATPMSLVRP